MCQKAEVFKKNSEEKIILQHCLTLKKPLPWLDYTGRRQKF